MTVDAVNQFSLKNAITKKDLNGLHAKIEQLTEENGKLIDQMEKEKMGWQEKIKRVLDEKDEVDMEKQQAIFAIEETRRELSKKDDEF